MNIEHSPLIQALKSHSDNFGEKTAIIEGTRSVSYSELYHNILKSAAFLCDRGICKGDRILLSARKEIEFVYLYFASQLLGSQNVVMDPAASDLRKEYIVERTHPKMMFGMQVGTSPAVQYADLDILSYEELDAVRSDLSVKDTADIMFTTGTTASPKGVLLSHLNIFSSARNINSFIGNSSEDVEVLGLPVCHSFGLGRLRSTLLMGGTMVLLGSFANIRSFFDTIEKYGVTGFGMVPAIWNYIKKLSGTRIGQYADRIRYIEIGSAPMPIDDKRLLMNLFPNTRICMHYGLTEASRALFMEFHENKNNLGTIGRPVCDDVLVDIFSDRGEILPLGVEGEICVSGNMVMQSYYSAEDNADAFWGKYFRTGDWGYKDGDGNFYLVSRKKELINVGGKKVSPVEIEEAVISLGFPDCACVGVKDDVLGEVPKVFIVKGKSDMTFGQIEKLLRDKIESYKVPAMYEWIEAVPTTSSGKKQRLSLLK